VPYVVEACELGEDRGTPDFDLQKEVHVPHVPYVVESF
jgi:hypothetical protein